MPFSMQRCRVFTVSLYVAISVHFAVLASAQEFRVQSEVFVADEETPIAENLTLFTASNVVYDFSLNDSQEIAMWDAKGGRLILLDPTRRQKATVMTEKLMEFNRGIKAVAASKKDTDLFEPRFEVKFDDAQRTLNLSSKRITYLVIGQPANEATAAQRYKDFADWYARLNAMRIGNMPPFGRLELNRHLAEHGLLPQEVKRTVIYDRAFGQQHEMRSKHIIDWMLSNTDRKRINEVGGYLASFAEVALPEYLRAAGVAGN